MAIPLPNAKPITESIEPIEPTSPTTSNLPIVTPKAPKRSGLLDDDEKTFILTTTLSPAFLHNPSVLAFIESFVRCKDIKQASNDAGIHRSLGYKYRQNKEVNLAITRIIELSVVKYGFDATEIVERTKEIVEFDPIEVYNADGTFKTNLNDIEPEARRSIKKLKVKNFYKDHEDINGIKTKIIAGEIIEYEFYDKLKAIELIGREKDLFKTTTKVEHTVSSNMANLLLESVKRGEAAKEAIEVESKVINTRENDNE